MGRAIPQSSVQVDQAETQAASQAEASFWDYAEPAGEEPDPLKRNVLQWRRTISSVRDPLAVFPGQPVDLIGFVHRSATDLPRQFTLARSIIRCCLADTVPLGLTVYTPDADLWETNAWVHVQGEFSVYSAEQRRMLVIQPSALALISPPKQIYINGVF